MTQTFSLRAYYPKSFLRLLLLGFAVAGAPLVVALVELAGDMQTLAQRGEKAVYEATRIVRGSRLLAEQVRQLERSARRYVVLGDADLLAQFDQTHQRFRAAASDLSLLQLGETQLSTLNRLIDREAELFEAFSANPKRAAANREIAAAFAELADLAQSVLDEGNAMIDREVEAMRTMVERDRIRVLWITSAAIPLALAAAAGFAWLIANPIRQIDAAIRRLGDADFKAPVAVAGPSDLRYLGERLDWLRRRLADLEEQKASFLRAVSHELKTPLTSLREGAELLHDEVGGRLTLEQRELVQIMRHNSVQLQQQIDALLNYHRAQSRGGALNLARFELSDLVRRVAHDQEVSARARQARFTFELQPVDLVADAGRVRTVIDNLFTNALKFSPAGGAVRVSLRRIADHAVLEVTDEGPGVAHEDRKRIFDLYYQGKNRPFGLVKGSGFGLAIARELAEAHEGTLELADVPAGARFRLMLPLDAAAILARKREQDDNQAD